MQRHCVSSYALDRPEQLLNRHKDQGLEIIGISIDLDGPDAMQPVVSALKIDFPVYWYGEKAVEKFPY